MSWPKAQKSVGTARGYHLDARREHLRLLVRRPGVQITPVVVSALGPIAF
jgi:hypothetical protein